MSISVNEIRKDFPLLENQKVIYLDTAATSQKPACVLEAEREFYEKYNANPLRGLYELGEAATEKYEEAREMVREFLNAKEAAEIIFVRNATEGLNLVAYSFGSLVLKPGDEILVSIMEHSQDRSSGEVSGVHRRRKIYRGSFSGGTERPDEDRCHDPGIQCAGLQK